MIWKKEVQGFCFTCPWVMKLQNIVRTNYDELDDDDDDDVLENIKS